MKKKKKKKKKDKKGLLHCSPKERTTTCALVKADVNRFLSFGSELPGLSWFIDILSTFRALGHLKSSKVLIIV